LLLGLKSFLTAVEDGVRLWTIHPARGRELETAAAAVGRQGVYCQGWRRADDPARMTNSCTPSPAAQKALRASGFPARAVAIEKPLNQFRGCTKSGLPQSRNGGREIDQVTLGGDQKNGQRTRYNQIPAGCLSPTLCFVDDRQVRSESLGQYDRRRFSRVQPG
jgi:hypothetical protein